MRLTPLLPILVALVLAVGLYFGVNTIPPKPKMSGEKSAMGGGSMVNRASNLNIDSLIIASKKGLAQHALAEIQSLEKQLMHIKDSSQLAPLFTQYADIWQEHKEFPLAAHYYSLAAKLENSEKKLTFAAQLFLDLARNEHSAELQTWEANNAAACFEQSLKINPSNDTSKIGLAECYFGTGEAMKGVVLLKEITNKNPEHKAANLLLGQQGIVSGQWLKAKERFEKVLKNDPKNVEAMLGMAEALKGLGEKEKAIALLEKCKQQINKPEFDKDIDNYIKTFK